MEKAKPMYEGNEVIGILVRCKARAFKEDSIVLVEDQFKVFIHATENELDALELQDEYPHIWRANKQTVDSIHSFPESWPSSYIEFIPTKEYKQLTVTEHDLSGT